MIIGICGLAGSGKDTLADQIIKQNPNFKKLKMASFLKDAVSILFGYNREWLDGETEESRKWREQVDEYWDSRVNEELRPFTPRKALQYVGTDLFRNQVCSKFWVYSVERYIQQNSSDYIITDCRFREELDSIKSLNGTLVEISRNEPDWCKRIKEIQEERNSYIDSNPVLDAELTQLLSEHHPSETNWIGYPVDYTINNDGEIEDLYEKAKELITLIAITHAK